MGNLADFRAKYPGAYDHVDDQTLADAIYRKFYSHADRREFDARIGLKPYANALEAAGAAVVNAPARVMMGVEGLAQAGREGLSDIVLDLESNADTIAASPTRPSQFDLLADYSGADTREESAALAEQFWQRYRDPATRADVLREIGTTQAKGAIGAQLRRDALARDMQKPDVKPGSLEDYFGQVVGAVAESSPGLVAAVATRNPVPALIAVGGTSYGQAYSSGREKGLDPDDARTYATLNAAAEAVPELLPLGVFLKEGGSILNKVAGGGLAEGASEALTAGIQALIDRGYLEPDMTWGEAWPKIRDAAIVGGGAGVLMGGVAAGADSAARAAGEATSAGLRVSSDVIGQLGATLGKRIQESHQAAEMAADLSGKPFADRVAAFAEKRRLMLEPKTAAAPTEEEGGPTTEELLRHFEGFRTEPYWDANAYRVGYGSDTITTADGKVHRVAPGDVVSEEDAERDLARRLNDEFIPSARTEVGVTEWDALPPYVQAALGSVTYNYGNLPDSVAAAARSGDIEAIADAVEGLAGHNGGVNADRRAQEAAIIRGEKVDLSAGRGPTGTRQLVTRLDLADRALRKLEGALGEEGFARSSRKLLQDERGIDTSPETAARLGKRQAEANEWATQQRENLRFLLADIRRLLDAGGPALEARAEKTAAEIEKAIEELPAIPQGEAKAKLAEQTPLEPVPEPPLRTPSQIAAEGLPALEAEMERLTASGEALTPEQTKRMRELMHEHEILVNQAAAPKLTGKIAVPRQKKPKAEPKPKRVTEEEIIAEAARRRALPKTDLSEIPAAEVAKRQLEVAAVGGFDIDLGGDPDTVRDLRSVFGSIGGDEKRFTGPGATLRIDAERATDTAFIEPPGEASADVRARVEKARKLVDQVEVSPDRIPREAKELLAKAKERFDLDDNTVLSVARVLAAMQGKTRIDRSHVAEAISYSLRFEGAKMSGDAPRKQEPTETAITPSGNKIEVRPEVVELASLKKATGDLQPRDRSRASSDAQIEEIAANLDFDRLRDFRHTDRGAPIVGPDNIVESGNGRVGGIRRAAEAYPEKYAAYVEAMRAAGYDTKGIKQPVLVSRRITPMSQAEREAFALDSNKMAVATLSASEQAEADAKMVDRSLVDALKPGEDPSGPRSAFAKAFLAKLPTSERAGLLDRDGQLNSDGVRRIRNALLAAAYGNPQTTARAAEDVEDSAKSITGALLDVAPQWVAMRQAVKESGADPAYDMTDSLMTAINLLARAREKAAQQGRPVKALINEAVDQIDMLSGAVDPVAVEFVKAFYTEGFGRAKSRDDIGVFLNAITQEVGSAIQPQLLGEAPKPGEVISGARRKSEREQGQTGLLFASAPGGGRAAQRSPNERKPAVPQAGRSAESEVDGEPQTSELRYTPGAGWVPTLRMQPPARQPIVEVADGDMPMPADRVTMRDEPRKRLLRIIGDRLYQEKVRGKSRLGFYRHANSEIRIKHYDDTEVMAHEAAHFLEFHSRFKKRFAALRQRYAGELNPLSYTTDPRAVGPEGFAEYVRLWATQYAQAKAAAPNFTRAFEAELRKAGLWRDMLAFQKAAHRWYYQGDLARFRGKSGESAHFADALHRWMMNRHGERFIQGFIDPFYAAKVAERETTGTISSAERSPWKLFRMTRGAESMLEAAIEDGALVVEPDGSYSTTGKGLKDIFWPATHHGAKRFDELMEYFKARRAAELMKQKRENLFTPQEVIAGLNLGKTHPEFRQIFDEWLAFNDAMLDFYVATELITADMAAAFREKNKNYVPFFRVRHQVEGDSDVRGSAQKIGKTLTGGERNTAEIATNIIDGLHANIQAALVARAKAHMFRTLQASQEGSTFAVEIPAGSKRQKVAEDQMRDRLVEVLIRLGKDVVMPSGVIVGPGTDPNPVDVSDIETLLQRFPELVAFWQHNQQPSTVETGIESTIVDGKVRHFEINSRLLMDMLVAPRAAPLIVQVLRWPKRVLTNLITGLPQFQIPNAVRDTLSMAALSPSRSRAGYETLRGFRAYLANDPRFKAFRANGGLFAGRVTAQNEANRKWAQLALPSRNGFDTVGKVLAGYRTAVSAVETGSRLGEFARARDQGINPLEAAFRGRMISGDFAQMGRNEVWGWLLQITGFANAGLRGIETMLTNLVEVDGKVRLPKALGKLALMTVTRAGATLTAATAALWLLNHDDERYKALTVDEKARYWHVWLMGQHIQIPKPYGVGFVFADLPEIALDYVANRDGEAAAKQLAFGLMQHFWFMDYPTAAAPFLEATQNRKFTGAPIVPPQLEKLTGDDLMYQRTDNTPQAYRDLAAALKEAGIDMSPVMAEHYAKGFTGYLEAYMVDAYEHLAWNDEKWGERPFARDVFSYFIHQFNGREQPYRTKWTEGYYELRARAQSKAQAYSLLFKEGARDLSDFTEFSKSEVNLVLRSLAKKFAKVDKAFEGSDALLSGIKYNPKLSRSEKEQRIDAFYAQRNELLGTTYKEISALVAKLEQGIKK